MISLFSLFETPGQFSNFLIFFLSIFYLFFYLSFSLGNFPNLVFCCKLPYFKFQDYLNVLSYFLKMNTLYSIISLKILIMVWRLFSLFLPPFSSLLWSLVFRLPYFMDFENLWCWCSESYEKVSTTLFCMAVSWLPPDWPRFCNTIDL